MNQHDAASGIADILHREGPAIRRVNGPLHVCPNVPGILGKSLTYD